MKKVKKFIKSNIKVVIAFVLGGIIIGTGGVYAATVISANNVSFSGSTSGLTSTNLQDALNEAYSNCKTKCPEGNVCTKTWVKIGDYVSMTPSSTSYTTSTSMTGYSSTQTINPSELNLWRVIGVNSNGTIDIVSEYVSSTYIDFQGKTGYQNYVGYLNTIAKQYENDEYTVGSRHIGYNGTQTEYITDTTALIANTAPGDPTSSSNITSETEAKGLGDMGYETDINLVKTACGTLEAKDLSGHYTNYWLASRQYIRTSGNDWEFGVRYINLDDPDSFPIYEHDDNGFSEWGSTSYVSIRPIVTLKSGIKASSGDGSSSSPYLLA